MNVLFFSKFFYPHIGGVEKHLEQVSKHLINKGYNITIITESFSKNLTKQEEIYKNIKIYRIPFFPEGKKKKFRIWLWLWQHRKLIRHADKIHIHDVFFWYLPFRALFPQKPVYMTFHGYESYPLPENARTMHKLAEKLSRGNICIGDFIPKWYGTKPTYVSYGAVDIATNNVSEKLPESAVFIGRLDEQTGILEYTKAVEIIRKKYPEFEFLVVGDGKYKSQIKDKVKATGFQKNPEKYFQKYHFAFVSRYLSILEAFAYKRPVFALYDNPIKEDYLKMAPFAKRIVIEDNAEKLARRVIHYLRKPEIERENILENYKWVKNQSWENLANLYLSLWKIK